MSYRLAWLSISKFQLEPFHPESDDKILLTTCICSMKGRSTKCIFQSRRMTIDPTSTYCALLISVSVKFSSTLCIFYGIAFNTFRISFLLFIEIKCIKHPSVLLFVGRLNLLQIYYNIDYVRKYYEYTQSNIGYSGFFYHFQQKF